MAPARQSSFASKGVGDPQPTAAVRGDGLWPAFDDCRRSAATQPLLFEGCCSASLKQESKPGGVISPHVRAWQLGAFLLLHSFGSVGLAQGLISFLNTPTTLISVGYPGISTAITNPAGWYYFGLFTAPAGTTDRYSFAFTGVYATNLNAAGKIYGGLNVVVPGWPVGEARALMVYGWPATAGPIWNPAWLNAPPLEGLGWSGIATGIAGGFDVQTGENLPTLNIFGSTTISAGFSIYNQCLSCNPPQIMIQPRDQIVAAGMNAQFSVGAVLTPQLSYQWYGKQGMIGDATNSVLQLDNVQLSQDGEEYFAVVSNPWGTVFSDSATLTVTPGAPELIGSPLTQTVEAGSMVHLSVGALGAAPLTYQWNWNFAPLNARTNSVLEWTNVQPAQNGPYTVIISNSYGAVTSQVAMLNVIAPVSRTMVPGLLLHGQTGVVVNIQFSPVLDGAGSWSTKGTLTLTNNLQWYFDPAAPSAQGAYRTSQAAQTGPALELYSVPAIALSGPIGSSLRVDSINQIGPVDAWQQLATVSLTNSPQLYFDASAVGQPPRLYRLLPGQ